MNLAIGQVPQIKINPTANDFILSLRCFDRFGDPRLGLLS